MYVWCHRSTIKTGRKLAEALGCKSRFKTPRPNDSMLLRWGNASLTEKHSIIQPAEGIARAGNKLVTLTLLKNADVLVPEFATTCQNDGATWLGRSTHGAGGVDIAVYNTALGRPTGHHDFYTKFVPNTREYRIHVFAGEILGVMGKYLDFPEQAGEGYVKNYAHGYRFRTPNKELKPDRLEAAKKAVAAVGLDFGAVDLLIGEDGRAYVLEINSAPGLAPLTFSKYVAAIKALASERGYDNF